VLFNQFRCNDQIGVRCFARHWRFMLANSRHSLKSLISQILRDREYRAGQEIRDKERPPGA
jgi:hypothetical protein